MTLLGTLTRTGLIPEYGNNSTKEPVSYLAIIEILKPKCLLTLFRGRAM
jgi:hypothetical protein